METITLTKEGLKRLCNKTSGTTTAYKEKLIEDIFEAYKSITDGTYEKED